MRRIYFSSAYYCSVLKHIVEVYKVAVVHVLRKIIGIMEVDNAVFMRFYNVFVEQKTFRNVFAYFSCHIIALDAYNR